MLFDFSDTCMGLFSHPSHSEVKINCVFVSAHKIISYLVFNFKMTNV